MKQKQFIVHHPASIVSRMMPGAGLEPARLAAQASKTCAAANYATPATLLRMSEIKGLIFESLAVRSGANVPSLAGVVIKRNGATEEELRRFLSVKLRLPSLTCASLPLPHERGREGDGKAEP